VAGDLTVVNSNGNRHCVLLVKGIVDVKDRFGSITVQEYSGQLTIVGGNGPVELTDAGISKVDNSFGPVTARNIHGTLSISNNNGAIEANTVNGSADLNGSFGAITFNGHQRPREVHRQQRPCHRRANGWRWSMSATVIRRSVVEQISGGVEVRKFQRHDHLREELKANATLKTSFVPSKPLACAWVQEQPPVTAAFR